MSEINKARNMHMLNRKTYAHYRVGGVRRDEKTGLRIVPGVASTGAIDRYGEIINPKGWELENYMKNPVFLWAHSYGIPPIGKVINIEKSDEALNFEAMETKTENDFAKMIFDYYENKEMNAFSVGFMPLAVDWHDQDKDDPFYGVTEWTRSELLENSAVPVPANQEALQLMFKNGIDEPTPFTPARVVGYEGTQIESAIKAFDATVIKSPYLKDEHKELLRDTAGSLMNLIGMEPKGGEEDEESEAKYEALMNEVKQLAADRYMLMQYMQICSKLMKAVIAQKH
jgi:Caudovirus prohead protease.